MKCNKAEENIYFRMLNYKGGKDEKLMSLASNLKQQKIGRINPKKIEGKN